MPTSDATNTKACFGLMYHPDERGHAVCSAQECADCHLFDKCMQYIIATSLRHIVDKGVDMRGS